MKHFSIYLIAFALTFWTGMIPVRTLDKLASSLLETPTMATTPYSRAEQPEEDEVEYFADDYRIGRRGQNKIEIRCFSRGSERLAEIRFYTRTRGRWAGR